MIVLGLIASVFLLWLSIWAAMVGSAQLILFIDRLVNPEDHP